MEKWNYFSDWAESRSKQIWGSILNKTPAEIHFLLTWQLYHGSNLGPTDSSSISKNTATYKKEQSASRRIKQETRKTVVQGMIENSKNNSL